VDLGQAGLPGEAIQAPALASETVAKT